MDPTSGLVYMQQRYYDPATGRFISPDPVAPTPGNIFNFGRYTYANDNPIRYTDPDGRQPCPQCLYYPPSIAGSYQHQAEIRQGASQDALEGTAVVAAGAVAIVVSGGADTPEVAAAGADVAVDAVSDAGADATTEVADTSATKSGLGNPFKHATRKQLVKTFERKELPSDKKFIKTGNDPENGVGNYINPDTGRGYHIDPKGRGKYPDEPNHVDVHRPRGYRKILDKKKLPYSSDSN